MPVSAAPPSGFRDFLPEQVLARQEAMRTISAVYRRFGFQPIQTSTVEELPVLLGEDGGENEKLIFKILKRGDKLAAALAPGAGENDLCDMGLRFDLTLPLARYYSKHGSQLPHPFKAFHLGPVWRAERAQKGRFREFTQCDVDIVGADSWAAEVDVIAAILSVFGALGLGEVAVHLNDRAFVRSQLDAAEVPSERQNQVCIEIDKLDKIGLDKVRQSLAALLQPRQAQAVEAALLVERSDMPENLRRIADAVKACVPGALVRFDPGLMRGLGYYTGPVFEFRHPSLSGSLGGGGRYDRLTEKFGGPATPACGGSIGFERLMMLLEESGRGGDASGPDAVMTVFSEELRERALAAAAALRASGLTVDAFAGSAKLKAQFRYADQKRAAYALVLGPDEVARGVLQVKNLKTGAEAAMPLDEARARIAARL